MEYINDIISAQIASFIVSPFITIIDRTIIENASNKKLTFIQCIKPLINDLIKNPIKFIKRKEFLWIHGLYSSTYLTANIIDTTCEKNNYDNQLPKFIGTAMINISLCTAKDNAFTQMFSNTKTKNLPLISLGLFSLQNSMTVVSSFNLPNIISNHLENNNIPKNISQNISQFICPISSQFLSTPLQLFGLDLYNRPNKISYNQRINFIKINYVKSVIARVARIGPAFGIGGISNNYIKNKLNNI